MHQKQNASAKAKRTNATSSAAKLWLLPPQQRRSAIELVIRHSKADHDMRRNYLQGQRGDCLSALLAGCGPNLR